MPQPTRAESPQRPEPPEISDETWAMATARAEVCRACPNASRVSVHDKARVATVKCSKIRGCSGCNLTVAERRCPIGRWPEPV